MDAYESVKRFLSENDLLKAGDMVIAGLSGGGDSVCLCHILWRLAAESGFFLSALHVHHGIRENADGDEAFVRAFCEERGIPLTVRRADVAELARERHSGLEETGRMVRRQAFEEAAKEWEEKGVRTYIALAHKMEDLAETFLFNLCRGAGLLGLTSLRPVSGRYIRPLLAVPDARIASYLKREGLSWRTDESNESLSYTRNRIRHKVLPLLEEAVCPGAPGHIASCALTLLELREDYLSKAREILSSCREGEGYLFGESFFSLSPALQGQVLLLGMEELLGSARDLGRVHADLLRSLMDRDTGRRLCLPGGLFAEKVCGGVFLAPSREEEAEAPLPERTLPIPGECPLSEGIMKVRLLPAKMDEVPQKKYTKWFDYDKIEEPLKIRGPKAGDYLLISPAGGRKLLRRYLIDEKVPKKDRLRVTVIAMGSLVLWIPGMRSSEALRVGKDTKTVLELSLQGGMNGHE